MDFFIKSYVHKLPSYIKDSIDFINKTSLLEIPVDAFLATLDVESLYTNVPHEGGLKVLHHYLSERGELAMPPNELLLELASFVLKCNYFKFEEDFYLQIKGTAMGSPFAPNYANLYVGQLE